MTFHKRRSAPAPTKMSPRSSSKKREPSSASLLSTSLTSSSFRPSSSEFHEDDTNPVQQQQLEKNKWSNYVVTIPQSQPSSNSSSSTSTASSSSSSSPFRFRQFTSLQFVLNICLVLVILLTINNLQTVDTCNEAVCASIVSKCTLTQSCKCEMKNCTCCKECFDCLSYLYSECCSCVELCPKPNTTNQVIMHSQVGDLKEPMPDLFNILTEETDLQGRWTTFTFPIDIDQSWFQPKPETPSTVSTNAYTIADGKITIDPSKDIVTVNCTVAYMSQCMPLNKCKNSCHSMGSSYFRWFHNGCCECVGTCINYGINESRCSECSVDVDEDDAEEPSEPSASPSPEPEKEKDSLEAEKKPEIPVSSSTTEEAAASAPAPVIEKSSEETNDDGEPT